MSTPILWPNEPGAMATSLRHPEAVEQLAQAIHQKRWRTRLLGLDFCRLIANQSPLAFEFAVGYCEVIGRTKSAPVARQLPSETWDISEQLRSQFGKTLRQRVEVEHRRRPAVGFIPIWLMFIPWAAIVAFILEWWQSRGLTLASDKKSAVGAYLQLRAPAWDGSKPIASSPETWWSGWLAKQLGGCAEFRLFTGRRVDVLVWGFAVEVEWCVRSKIAEAIWQAKHYAVATGRQPAIVVLIGRGSRVDERPILDEFVQEAARAGIAFVGVLDVIDPRPQETLANLFQPPARHGHACPTTDAAD